jgi:hypothetical protein
MIRLIASVIVPATIAAYLVPQQPGSLILSITGTVVMLALWPSK